MNTSSTKSISPFFSKELFIEWFQSNEPDLNEICDKMGNNILQKAASSIWFDTDVIALISKNKSQFNFACTHFNNDGVNAFHIVIESDLIHDVPSICHRFLDIIPSLSLTPTMPTVERIHSYSTLALMLEKISQSLIRILNPSPSSDFKNLIYRLIELDATPTGCIHPFQYIAIPACRNALPSISHAIFHSLSATIPPLRLPSLYSARTQWITTTSDGIATTSEDYRPFFNEIFLRPTCPTSNMICNLILRDTSGEWFSWWYKHFQPASENLLQSMLTLSEHRDAATVGIAFNHINSDCNVQSYREHLYAFMSTDGFNFCALPKLSHHISHLAHQSTSRPIVPLEHLIISALNHQLYPEEKVSCLRFLAQHADDISWSRPFSYTEELPLILNCRRAICLDISLLNQCTTTYDALALIVNSIEIPVSDSYIFNGMASNVFLPYFHCIERATLKNLFLSSITSTQHNAAL